MQHRINWGYLIGSALPSIAEGIKGADNPGIKRPHLFGLGTDDEGAWTSLFSQLTENERKALTLIKEAVIPPRGNDRVARFLRSMAWNYLRLVVTSAEVSTKAVKSGKKKKGAVTAVTTDHRLAALKKLAQYAIDVDFERDKVIQYMTTASLLRDPQRNEMIHHWAKTLLVMKDERAEDLAKSLREYLHTAKRKLGDATNGIEEALDGILSWEEDLTKRARKQWIVAVIVFFATVFAAIALVASVL